MTIPSDTHATTASISNLSKRRSLSKLSPSELRAEASTLLHFADSVPKSMHGSIKSKNNENQLGNIDPKMEKAADKIRVRSITETKNVDRFGNETVHVKITYSDGSVVEEKKPGKTSNDGLEISLNPVYGENIPQGVVITTGKKASTEVPEENRPASKVADKVFEPRSAKSKVTGSESQEGAQGDELCRFSIPNPQENVVTDEEQQDVPENPGRLWHLVMCLALVVAVSAGIVSIIAIKKRWDSIDDQNDNVKAPMFQGIEIDTNNGQSVLDALIASGAESDQSTLTVRDMFQVLNSTSLDEKTAKKLLDSQISKSIDQALENSNRNKGRFLEFTRAKNIKIDQNLVSTVKGISLPCVIHFPSDISSNLTTFGKAAYAAYMFVSTSEVIPPDVDLNIYSPTFLLRAEVIEHPTMGLAYFPKEYCLDTDYSYWNYGTNYFPSTRYSKRDVDVSFGNSGGSLTLSRLIYSLFSTKTNLNGFSKFHDTLINAYKSPKLELKAFIETIDDNACTFITTCKQKAKQKYLDKGVTLSNWGLDIAYEQYKYMKGVLNNWRGSSSQKLIMDAPFLFDSNIATRSKNSGLLLYDRQLNPYFSTKDLNNLINDSGELGDNLASALQKNYRLDSAIDNVMTNGALVSAMQFPVAMKRRMYEFGSRAKDQLRLSKLKDMGMYGEMVSSEKLVWDLITKGFYSQTLKYDKMGRLLEGDLSNKVVGKSADWFMITPFDEPKLSQDLLQRYQNSVPSSYSRAMNEAYDADHPCNSTAENLDYYLLLLGTLTAIFGGVSAFIHTLHRCLYWWNKNIRQFFGLAAEQDTAVMGIKRLLPTYELVLVTFAWCAFFGLQAPLINQTTIERKASAYKSTGYDIFVEYARKQNSVPVPEPGLAIVNLVHVDSHCDGANPDLYLFTTVIGLVVGIIVNMDLVEKTIMAIKRYGKRVCVGETKAPRDSVIYSETVSLMK